MPVLVMLPRSELFLISMSVEYYRYPKWMQANKFVCSLFNLMNLLACYRIKFQPEVMLVYMVTLLLMIIVTVR